MEQILYKHRVSSSIGIFFPYKNPARKKYVTLRTSCIQATHLQCCHNHGTNVDCLLDSCRVMAWSRWHMTCCVGSSHSSHHPAKFVDLAPCESEEKIFLTCHVTTQLKCHVTLWVHFTQPKSPPC